MASAAAPIDENPALWSGPTLVGGLLMYMCYGLLLNGISTFIYYYKPGRPFLRNHAVLVAFVTLVTTINLGFVTYLVWKRLVLDTAIPAHSWRPPKTTIGASILNGTIAVCTQLFFARKVYVLGGAANRKYGRIPGLVITFLSFCHLCAAYATSIVFGLAGQSYPEAMKIVIGFNNATALIVDVVITGSIIAFLSHYKSRSAFSSTKQLLNTITRHTIENGLAITLTVTINVIIVYTRKDNVHEPFRMVLPVLYALTLVTSLNRASSAADKSNNSQSMSVSGNNIALSQTAYAQQANVITFDRDASKRPFSSVQVQVAHQVERSVSGPEDDSLTEKVRAWDDVEHTRTQQERGDQSA